MQKILLGFNEMGNVFFRSTYNLHKRLKLVLLFQQFRVRGISYSAFRLDPTSITSYQTFDV